MDHRLMLEDLFELGNLKINQFQSHLKTHFKNFKLSSFLPIGALVATLNSE